MYIPVDQDYIQGMYKLSFVKIEEVAPVVAALMTKVYMGKWDFNTPHVYIERRDDAKYNITNIMGISGYLHFALVRVYCKNKYLV